ncbi:MAG TPA: hypothetical protein VG713_01700 [Pirellulales bacterium]|nr:hypothetical protein [Pirellulales bacterium]
MNRIARGLALLLVSCGAAVAQEGPKPAPVPDRATLEKQFEETLSGATLVGTFTVAGREDNKPLKEEKYTISKVSKVRDDYWMFQARIQYGDHDATLPLTLEVKWAGDTPVITLTDMAVPGFGTFTCRVLIYRDQYCGTWSGGDHGGTMFGRVVREPK